MFKSWSPLGLGALLLSVLPLSNASADHYPYSSYSCTTTSNGYTFYSESADYSYAMSEAIRDCKTSHYTSNSECKRNVRCSDAYNPYDMTPNLELAYLMEGTWTTSNCSNCYLEVTRYGNQLYGNMSPWGYSGSYSHGMEPIIIIHSREVQYRGDRFSVEIVGTQIVMRNLTGGGGRNIHLAQKYMTGRRPLPMPPPMPPAYPTYPPHHPQYPTPATRPIPAPPPRPAPVSRPSVSCPPNTVYDASIGRCVSAATPPRGGISTPPIRRR